MENSGEANSSAERPLAPALLAALLAAFAVTVLAGLLCKLYGGNPI